MSYKISKITPSNHVKDRYYIDFDGEVTLTVTINQIADYSLFTGRELEEEEFKALLSDANLSSAKSKALKMLGTRPMSKKEIQDRLARKGTDENSAEKAIDWLENIGAVNDTEYASQIVRHYAQKGYGLGRIRDELYKRGIPRELWDDALSCMPETDELIARQLNAKLRGSREKEDITKAANALYRRGYSWDEIRAAIESLRLEDENDR